jgi:glycosyltransferase involved in cell wall biosynthesis
MDKNENQIDLYNENNDQKTQILFLIIIMIFLIISFILKGPEKNNIENKILRFFKYKKKELIHYKDFEKELPSIKEYVNSLKNNLIKNDINYTEIVNPKVSFIASVYNKEKYLASFISSIQNQLLKEFEIILVDDCSIDRSIDIINDFKNYDKRIKLIQNKKNMGSLFTRYNGAIHAKGEFIIFVDADDIILKEGIFKAYNHITRKNLDIVEFHAVFDKDGENYIRRKSFICLDVIYQPILSYIYYYRKNDGDEKNTALWDKLVKKEIVYKSLSFLGENYIKERIIIENDVILLFSIFKHSNSFQYIDELGYYYFRTNKDSITNTCFDEQKSNQIMHSIFINIKFLYENTENTFIDKYFCLYKLRQGYNRYKKLTKYLNNIEFDLIYNILIMLEKSKYIYPINKILIYNIQMELNRTKIF